MGHGPDLTEPVTDPVVTGEHRRKLPLPADDLVPLEVAYNMLGKHCFSGAWRKDMSRRVRLGQATRDASDNDKKAREALAALTQCVQNGWLPLFYFVSERPVRRVEYYRNPSGLALQALYPRPNDDDDAGYIELDSGDIWPCMVDVGSFALTLQRKFGARSRRRGPPRDFAEFDKALDAFYLVNPPQMRGMQVMHALNFKGRRPERTIAYARIDEAAERAIRRVRQPQTPDKTPDG